ncbi:TOBE domain-containing protein, partial [Teichococcus cervicalis]
VELVEDLGASALVHGRLAGGAAIAFHAPAEAAPRRGGHAGISLAADRLHLFDNVTGQRIALEAQHETATPGLDFAPL